MRKSLIILLLLPLLLAGCQSYKKVPYLQDALQEVAAGNTGTADMPLYDARIMPKDLLTIVVSCPEEPELADEIRKKMFVFEDILLLDDRAIQRVLRDVDNADLGVALKAANEEVQNVIFKNLSKRLAAMIKEDMEFMGPVRMKDVEEAQQKVVSVIRKLEDSGEIVISRGGGDEIVV